MQVTSTRRAPTRVTRRPESGIAASDPTATNSSAKPRPRSVAPMSSRTAGMRDTQVAKSPPLAAKTKRVAQVARPTSNSSSVAP
jgi:hypothetical protein